MFSLPGKKQTRPLTVKHKTGPAHAMDRPPEKHHLQRRDAGVNPTARSLGATDQYYGRYTSVQPPILGIVHVNQSSSIIAKSPIPT